jgi:hypothetical protein
MSLASSVSSSPRKAPWHLWVVGIVALLWNASGAYTIMMAQAGKLAGLSAEEAAYYAAQPLWFVVTTDIALLSAIAAALALLLRSRAAMWLFAVSVVAILVTDGYDLASGASRAIVSTGALIVTAFILVIAILELVYARAMTIRGVLGGAK